MTGKTGFTGEAGYCYAAELSDGDRTFILTLLGCGWPPHKTWKWEDVRTLYRYGKEHFFYRNFAFEEKQVRIPLRNGAYKDWICVGSETQGGKREFRLLVSEEERPTAEYDLKKALDTPVKAADRAEPVPYGGRSGGLGSGLLHGETVPFLAVPEIVKIFQKDLNFVR